MNRRLSPLPMLAAFCAAAALLLTACGGGGGGTPPNITAAGGGTVTSADGRVTLVVPPGAASRDMTVSIVSASPTTPGDVGVLAGYGYAIEGDGGDLGADATLSFNVDPAVLGTKATPTATGRRTALSTDLSACPPGYLPQSDGAGPGFVCVKIGPTAAVVSSGALTAIDTCLFTTGTAKLACTIRSLAPKTVVLLHDKTPPTGDITITPSPMTAAGTLTVTVTASDNKGVDTVLILPTRTVGGVVTPFPVTKLGIYVNPPYPNTGSWTIDHAYNGNWNLRVGIFDKNGNHLIFDRSVLVDIPPPPVPDTTAPTVTLGASTTTATVGDTVTLTASASDDVGVTKVEFFKGATLLGERTAAPYTWTTAAYTGADVGVPQVYTAKAHDAAGNNATSGAVTVTVSAVSTGDVYVNAASGSDGNAGSSGAPFKTLAKAFTAVGAGGTVWLQNGAFTAADEGTTTVTGRTVPTGVTVRSVNPGGASIGFPIRFAGNGSVVATAFDMSANGTVVATGGNVLVSRPSWVKLGAVGTNAAIAASGSAKVTLDDGGNPAHEYFAAVGVARLADLSGSAELLVNGGRIDRLSGGGSGWMLGVADTARVTMNGVVWTNAASSVVAPTAIDVQSSAGTVTLNNTTIDLSGATDATGGGNACIRLRGPAATTTLVVLDASMLKACPGDGIQVREGTPTVTLQNGASIRDAVFHGLRSSIYGSVSAAPAITLTNAQISGSGRSGIEMLGGGSLSMTTAVISGNGKALAQGGVRMLNSFPYQLTMRSSSAGANAVDPSNGALLLQGNASSSFDLGTKASPGANVIANSTGASATSLRVQAAAGVTVQAVGNTFNASTQGANASGQYTSASSVCGGANPCTVTSGSGANFVVSSGALRLVDD